MSDRISDRIFGLIWFALGSGMAIEGRKLGMGSLSSPGSGFVPFLAGSSLALCGLVLVVLATIRKGKGGGKKTWGGQNWRNLVIPVLSVVIYAFLMEPLGFLISTFLLVFVLLKMTDPKRWLSPVLTSLLVVLSCHILFSVLFKIPLPKGFWGIG
jgi:putative tricarboxylic transport membrane protein